MGKVGESNVIYVNKFPTNHIVTFLTVGPRGSKWGGKSPRVTSLTTVEFTAPDITFIGNHTHSLDLKSRAVLPKKWRGEENPGFSFMVRYDKGGYLMFYPPNQVALLRKRVNSIKEGKNRHLVEQALFGEACEVECDSAGRITLPEKLVTLAGFKKEGLVTFVAQGETFSLWDSERYESQVAQRAEVDVFELMASLEN